MPIDLAELTLPAHTAVLTMEIQRGVVGDLSTFPQLADAAAHVGVIPATRAAASASCGKALRSPTTPRWISMVSTALWAGRVRSARSMGIGQV